MARLLLLLLCVLVFPDSVARSRGRGRAREVCEPPADSRPLTLGAAASQKAPPPDAKCGSAEWAPFGKAVIAFCKKKKNFDCKLVLTWLKDCSYCRIKLPDIKGADVAKGKFTYVARCGDMPTSQRFSVDFSKQGARWTTQDVTIVDP